LFMIDSAKMLRAELPVQRNSTLWGRSLTCQAARLGVQQAVVAFGVITSVP